MACAGAPDFPSSGATTGHLVDELELAFQNCYKSLTSQEHFNASDSEELKTGVEQSIQKFIDLARQTEAVFLQKRLLLSVKKPEQVVKEDIQDLRQELERKEASLQKYQKKLQHWQNLTRQIQPGAGGQQGAQVQVTQPSSSHPVQQQTAQAPSQSLVMPPAGNQAHPYSDGPGPLAYLQQTMSNIGMPEKR